MFCRLLLVLAILLAPLVGPATAAAPNDRYAEGQVWSYQARPQDQGSLLKIQRIEQNAKRGPIYHISIIGLSFAGKLDGVLAHAPVSRAALDASVTTLAASSAAWPDAAPGIAQWRSARGGVFTISVAAIVQSIDDATANKGPTT